MTNVQGPGPEIDALFRRWQETGDPAALGKMFDGVAGDLFRVAVSLCGDGAAAEDAVQETFLAAMRAGGGFDRSRPVMPWLLGILGHKAVDARRSIRRRPDPLRVDPPIASPDPATEAERREAVAQVREALDRLPDPYRAVALLRWEYGMEPGDIARVLGSPPGTVRSLLSRARERLERALRGVPLLAVLGVRAPRGLPAVRSHVLREASRVWVPAAAGSGGVGALLLGGLLMTKKAMAVTAAALFVLGSLGWWAFRGRETAALPADPASLLAAGSAAHPARDPAPPADAQRGAAAQPAGSRLALRVVDSAGRPVAGALAALADQPPKDETNPWRQRFAPVPTTTRREFPAATGSDGAAAVEGVSPGVYKLRVTAERFAVHHETIEVARDGEELGRIVVLLPAWTLAGTVYGPGGEALGGAEVLTGECACRADASGRYRLERLPPGTHDISVRHEGALFLDMEVVVVPGPRSLDLHLPGGAAIEGRVVDDATGTAVGGAEVFLLTSTAAPGGSGLRGSTHRGVTDGAGAFRIGGVPTWTPAMLEIRAQGFMVFSGWYTSVFAPHFRFAPGDTLRVEVRLHAGSIVRGRITGPGGTPVAGATVDVLGMRRSGETDAATAGVAGPDGRYALRSPAGRGLLRVRAPGLVQPGLPEKPWEELQEGRIPPECLVEVAPEGETIRDVALLGTERAPAGTAAIAGRVRTEDGAPPGAAWVDVRGPGGTEHRVAVLPDGAFRVEGLPTGDFGLTARCEGRPPAPAAVGALGKGEERTGIEIVLPLGGTLEGRVADSSGQPVAGATVRVSAASGGSGPGPVAAVSDEDGRFTLAALPLGTLAVEAAAPGFVPAARTAKTEDARIDVVMERSLSISGVVAEEGSGRAVAGLLVWANRSTSRSGMVEIREALTDAEGRFRIGDLDAVQYDLATGRLADRGPAADFAPSKAAGVAAGREDLRILVRPGLSIAGRVLDREGHPVPGGTIDANGPDGGTPVWKREPIGPDGAFRLRGLPEGLYTLQVQPGSGLSPARLPRVPAGTTDLEVRVVASLVIKGRLLLEDGSPLPAGNGVCDLRWRNPDGSSASTTLGAWGRDGSFQTGPLDPGLVYDFVFHGRPGILGGAARGIAPGTEDLVVVVRKGGSVEGRVVDEDGNGIAGIWVGAETREIPSTQFPEPGRSTFARTDGRGAFRLEGMAPVPYEVRAGGSRTDYLDARLKSPVEPGTSGIVLRLKSGSFLEGRIVDASGAPWGEGYVQARGEGGWGDCRVGRNGEFSIRGIPPGEYTLHLQVGQGYVDLGTATAPAKDLVQRKPEE